MLKTTVYISDINNLSDARYCAGMMVDYLGFNIGKIGVEEFREITQWVEGTIVAEFNAIDVDKINSVIEEFKLDYVALNADSIPGDINTKVILISDKPNSNCEFQLVDKESIDNNFTSPILVSGDFQPNDIDAILSHKNVKGICLKGGDEISPGQKDFDDLADILEILED